MEVQPINLDDVVGVLQRKVNVAVVVYPVPRDVGPGLLVQHRRSVLHRLDSIHHHRQWFVFDLYELRGISCRIARVRQHDRDRVALIANLVNGEWPLLDPSAVAGGNLEEGNHAHLPRLFPGQYGVHAFQRHGG